MNISQRLEKLTTRHRQSERLTPSPLLYTYSLFKINKELLIGEVCPTVKSRSNNNTTYDWKKKHCSQTLEA